MSTDEFLDEDRIAELYADGLVQQRFWAWHHANPHVYELFKRFAYEWHATGRRRCSGWWVINRARWETNIVTRGDDFKISNDFIALYARLFTAEHLWARKTEKREGFFVLKQMKHCAVSSMEEAA